MPVKRDLVLEASAKAKSLQLDEIITIRDAWLKFDINGDGEVSTEEVHDFLKLLFEIPDEDKETIVKALDRYIYMKKKNNWY